MYQLVCLLLLTSQALALDEEVDNVISNLTKALREDHLDSIPIADVGYHWKYHILPGSLHCSSGMARSLGSLNRSADVEVTYDGHKVIILKIPLTLESLSFSYEKCMMSVVHIFSWKGFARATVHSNDLEARVNITKAKGKCKTTLDSLKFVDVGEISIVTGGKLVHEMQVHAVEPLAAQMHKDIVGRINENLYRTARKVFATSHLCKHI